MTARFDRDTAVHAEGGGSFGVRVDEGWWVARGPNGGYVAALLLRALEGAVGDAARTPRSLTVHYTAPPAAGPARVTTRVERVGRSLTTVSGRMEQDGRLLALALGAFSVAREGPAFRGAPPEVPPPERCPALEPRIEIHHRYETRFALGDPPFSGGPQALCGGWIRLAEPRPVDAAVAAAFCDAFPPAIFSTLREGQLTGGVPTVDLTVHFRARLPLPGARDDAYTLAVFRSRVAADGFVEEDGELWSPDGVLIAQSRQHALVL